MNIDTLKRLKLIRDGFVSGDSNDKFIIKSLNDIDKRNQIKAVDFIEDLINEGVDINRINVNDFSACPQPKVYVYCNCYKRFSDYDLRKAVKVARALKQEVKSIT